MRKYNHLFKKKNVVSIGSGFKYKNGKRTNELCIIVGVSKKEPLSSLNIQDTIPSSIDNIITDVIELGYIKAQIDPITKLRPPVPGCSLGSYRITAGTFGCVVKKNGEEFILSNNHVLADSNNGQIGDKILQPGTYDGGNVNNDSIGVLHEYVPINFDGEETQEPPDENPNPPTPEPPSENKCFFLNLFTNTINKVYKLFNRKSRLQVITVSALNNTVDCALAKPIVSISKEIIEIGEPQGVTFPYLGQEVQKYGRTSKYTQGEVIQLNATVQVDYDGKVATFENQIITSAMSEGGDSGSVVLDNNKKIVGLLFAGSDQVTILNPIDEVFNKLGVTL